MCPGGKDLTTTATFQAQAGSTLGGKMILPLITTQSVQQVAEPRVLPPGKPDSKRLNACCPSPMSKAEFQGNRPGGVACSLQGQFHDFRHTPLLLAEKNAWEHRHNKGALSDCHVGQQVTHQFPSASVSNDTDTQVQLP